MIPVLFLILSIGGAAAQSAPAPDACLPPEEARQSVVQNHLIQIQEAARLANGKMPGEVVSANLCRMNERLVYVLAILASNGRVARIAIDAKTRAVTDLR